MKSDDDNRQAEPAETNTAASGTDAPGSVRHWSASLALAAAVAALIAAVLCLGWFGYTGIRAYAVDAGREQLRTESVSAAEQAVLNITEIDPSKMDEWKKALDSSLTGEARSQVDDGTIGQLRQLAQQNGKDAGRTESRISRSAATEVNTDEDTATVLVFANVKSVVPGQETVESVSGFLLTMVDVDGVRKASKVVPLDGIVYDESSAQPMIPGGAPAGEGGGN